MIRSGSVYKIICQKTNDVYVGSTFNLLKYRFQQHKSHYKRWLECGKSYCSIFPYFKQHGIENFKMMLIKSYEVVDRAHLEVYEQLWINKLKSVNDYNPFRIDILYGKAYRAANKQSLKEKKKTYYESNKESIKLQSQQYNKINQDVIKVKRKQYRANNADTIKAKGSEKITCDCGIDYTYSHRSRHFKTKKHTEWIASQTQTE